MCGISGFLGMNNDALIRKMTRILAHRGPDGEGIFSDDKVSLGHRRLSIIDLSRRGQQPMMDAAGRAVISYNGELYNYKALRKELVDLGIRFCSETDTEVVLNAYLQWGEECLLRFNGMFAFAIWDKRADTLFLARDRVGIKPLYVARKGGVFLFASEIKAILCWEEIRRDVNQRTLDYYFTFRFNPLEESLFKNVQKLLPAHYLKVKKLPDGRLDILKKSYWDAPTEGAGGENKNICDVLAREMERSVGQHLMSDVPLGVFLSGGIDSSAIVAIMRKTLGSPVNSFTVGFNDPGFSDELKQARYTSQFFETDHAEQICKPDINDAFPRVIWGSDELSANPSLMPTYLLSGLASKSVKVVLCGEGGDELFGGYQKFSFMKYAWELSSVSPSLAGAVPPLIGLIPGFLLNKMFGYSSAIGQKGRERLKHFCKNIRNVGRSYLDVSSIFHHDDKNDLYGPRLLSRIGEENIAETINREYFDSRIDNSDELFQRLSYFELKTRLPHDLLAKVDAMTMAHSLEARVPYLDHHLIETAFSIPAGLKLRMLQDKFILRKTLSRYLPRAILGRKKGHFFVPIHHWLRNELRPIMDRILTKKNIEEGGFLNSAYLLRAHRDYQNGSLVYARQIWSVVSFLIWHKLYIESDRFLTLSSEPPSLDALFSHSQSGF